MKLRIVMDGAGDMPENWAEQYDIKVIPINIQFGEKTFLQGIDLTDDDFYDTADRTRIIPKTSQPTPQQFIDFYQRIANQGDTILSMHVTSKLSGTFSSAISAAKELAGRYQIIALDSLTGSAALGYMCKEARLLERAGASVQKIVDRMNYISRNITVVLTLDSLEYAYRSGRVKALQVALASLLSVKPVVVLREGVLHMADRVRTRQRALDHIIQVVRDQVGDKLVNIAVVHARAPEVAHILVEKVQNTLNCCETIITDLSIGVAANLGPGTVGVVAYPVEEGL